MNYGLYVSASGALTAMRRMDVWSNNLANVDTVAFKPDYAFERQRDPERIEDHVHMADPDRLLERLGGGVLASPTRVDFSPGPVEISNNPLDVAIEGKGFLMVRTGAGPRAESLGYTRDGRLTVDAGGRLVTAAQGHPVLDGQGREISVPPGALAVITPGGDVVQDGRTLGQVAVVRFADESALVRVGSALFRARDGGERLRESVPPMLRTGAVEQSGVDPIRAMLAVQKAADDAQRNLRMIGMFDELMGQAINTFARIA